MRKAGGLVIVILLLGSLINIGTVQALSQDPYEDFWRILEKEANLIPEAGSGNVTAINELFQNSHAGAENAALISAQTWQALQELKSAGVKLYYTEEELRRMALEIKSQGLPQETVRALKEQGWSDEEVNNLQEYLIQHADEVSGDFNMSEFLTEFSNAFLRVAFKCNEYESKALEWKYWSNPGTFSIRGEEVLLPAISSEWGAFYEVYRSKSIDDKLSALRRLKERELKLIESGGKLGDGFLVMKITTSPRKLTTLDETSTKTSSVSSLPIRRVPIKPVPVKPKPCTIIYYWNALKAYNLTLQVESILTAQKFGNSNPELNYRLNEKVSELADALRARRVVNGGDCSGVSPPEPGILGGSLTEEALTAGRLEVKSVRVEPVEVAEDYATYRVVVEVQAVGNAVSSVNVEFKGVELSDAESGGFLYENEVKTVASGVSGRVYGSGSVEVSGVVRVSYESHSGPVPLSASSPETSMKLIEVPYSGTITLNDPVDPQKVNVSIIPIDEDGDSTILEGESVKFMVKILNENGEFVKGNCYIDISYPITSTETSIAKFQSSFSVSAGGSVSETMGELTYEYPGVFNYLGKCYFNQYSKTVSGSVTVISAERGSRSISGAFGIYPATIYVGDVAMFHYTVIPLEDSISNPTVTLESDDNSILILKKTYQGAVITRDKYLEGYAYYKFDRAGTYRITLKVNGLPIFSKNIKVNNLPELTLHLECSNEPVLLGETEVCNIIVKKNTLSADVPYAITTKMLDSGEDTSRAISTNIITDVIPAKFSGKIAEVFVPLDERMTEALKLSDVRDLTPRTGVWSCEDGTCYYTLKRADTPHYLKVTVRLGSDQYRNLEGIIMARYTGSKYWNEDADEGIKKGALMGIAPVGLAYAPVEYLGAMIVEMAPASEPVKTITQIFLFAKDICQGIWKEINFGG